MSFPKTLYRMLTQGEFVGIIFVSADDKELGTYQQRKQVQTIWNL